MTQFECTETGTITEVQAEQEAVFCTAMKFDLLYSQELPRFRKHPLDIYGLPFSDTPKKRYLGFDRHGLCGFDSKKESLTDGQKKLSQFVEAEDENADQLMHTLDHAEFYCSIFREEESYEILWCRPAGAEEEAPEGFRLLGLDIGYPPCCEGGFSLICDTLFFCRWHGCDGEGMLFRENFDRLNENGLFSALQDAKDYLARYMAQPWTERGTVGIFEVFGR